MPAEKETAGELLIANASRPAGGPDRTVGEWIGSLQLVVEPRLAATGVFLAADSAQIDTCELGLLEENFTGGPTLTEETEFKKDTIAWKVRHVFAAKFLDWRGMVRMVVT